jgi:hypothetical protein
MKFTHHHPHQWEFDPTRTYDTYHDGRPVEDTGKPHGLWLSVDGDWQEFRESSMMRIGQGFWGAKQTEFEVDLSRCLVISSVREIDRFDKEYVARNLPPGGYSHFRVDWRPLREEYAGIVIAPYIWDRRLVSPVSDWYYGWDCASGCIWDLSIVSPGTTRDVVSKLASHG